MIDLFISLMFLVVGIIGLCSIVPPEGKEVLYQVIFFVMIGYAGIRLLFR